MCFVTILVLLIGALPTAALGQDRGKPRVRVDVSIGIALPASPEGFRTYNTKSPELVAGVRYRLSPILDVRVSAEAMVLGGASGGVRYSAGGGVSNWLRLADPLLAFVAGPYVALSSAPTHMYLQGSLGVVAPFDGRGGMRRAPALGVGVGIRHRRGFGEINYTHAFHGYSRQEGMGYASLRLGVSPR